jgi:hypothetical protein
MTSSSAALTVGPSLRTISQIDNAPIGSAIGCIDQRKHIAREVSDHRRKSRPPVLVGPPTSFLDRMSGMFFVVRGGVQ